MTRYEQGFMAKCAEYGVPKQVAGAMLKAAQTVKSPTIEAPTKTHFLPDASWDGGRMVVRDFSDGTSTTNTANGYGSMPYAEDFRGYMIDPARDIAEGFAKLDYRGRPVMDPSGIDMDRGSRNSFLSATADGKPVLNQSGTNLVNNALSRTWKPGDKVPTSAPRDLRFVDTPIRPKWWQRLIGVKPRVAERRPDYDAFAQGLAAQP